MRRLIVLEVNEVPPALLRWHGRHHPGSAIAGALRDGVLGQTIVSDRGVHELYPSQTWASVGTGVPYDKHGIYWYGDPKPAEYPLYWQAVAKTRTVGVVGTLHSSPFATQCRGDNMAFAVPDVFGPDATTKPASLQPLQRFNQRMTTQNARAVSSTGPIADYGRGLLALAGSGVRPTTVAGLAKLAAEVAAGRVPKERLRTGQFLLMADVFEAKLRAGRPDLGVFFTNHLAAAMHRYWPASFPEDWERPLHGPEWVARHREEIPNALGQLDRLLGRLLGWCHSNDTTLILISSMGQVGGGTADEGGDRTLVVKDPLAFGRALGMPRDLEPRSAMVPHLTYHFVDESQAAAESRRLGDLHLEQGRLTIDRSGVAVTITYHLDELFDHLVVDGQRHGIEEAGLEWLAVSEHKAGTHHELGTLLVVNSPTAEVPDEPVDYLELAPAILTHMGMAPLPHHRQPRFVI